MKQINSKNYKDGKFQNLVSTRLSFRDNEGFGDAMKESFFGNKKIRSPQSPMNTVKFDKEYFLKKKDAFVWFGHSSLLLRVKSKTIAIDPVFERASPFSIMGPKPFLMKCKPVVTDLPSKIDVVLITHDHYDHLEYTTIKKIHKNVKLFLVPLGLKKIFTRWGVSKNKVKEFDWYDSTLFEKINFTFTPCRHFSGRTLTNRNSTLWGGWIIKSDNKNIYLSGDGGYFKEFKEIGSKFGPFDFMFVENGQYDKAWIDIHMLPEESVQASIDSKAKIIMPIHWGKYDLSVHPWKEPIERFVLEAKKKKINYTTPKIGEICNLKDLSKEEWWKTSK